MECSQVEEMIDSYIDRHLAPEEQAKVDEHVRSCGSCRQKVETATRSLKLVREALGWVTPGEEFDSKISSRVIELPPPSTAGKTAPPPGAGPLAADVFDTAERRRLLLLAVVAAVLFAAAAAAVIWSLSGLAADPGPPASPMSRP